MPSLKKNTKWSSAKTFVAVFCALLALAGGILAWSFGVEPRLLMVKQMSVSGDKITVPFNAVLFSDVHVGRFFEEERLDLITDKINALQPDIVLFAGDMLDSYSRDKPDLQKISHSLSQITSTFGKFAVAGNHDMGNGGIRVYDQMMSDGGFTVLNDRYLLIEELDFILSGVRDNIIVKYDTSFISEIPKEQFSLLLSHVPQSVNALTQSATVDYVLSGHTHGGQVGIPFLVEAFLPGVNLDYKKGTYLLPHTTLFVTSGIGTTSIPVRLFNIPEIVLINFKPLS